jgi:hypothetical protein
MHKTKSKLVRFEITENEALEHVARRLGLSVAELLRRSWRIARPTLLKLKAPGVSKREVEDD